MNTTCRDFFERMYQETNDPWSFASSEYERQRYATVMEFVPPGHFQNVFEPGCSVGELTVQLAERCGHVRAIDIAEGAVQTARRRCQLYDNVEVHQGCLPDDVPSDALDLVIFSEIGYYFTELELAKVAAALASRLEVGGQLIAVHWTGESNDHLLSGRRVHDLLGKHLHIDHLHGESHRWDDRDGFVLDIWRKAPTAETRRT